MLPGCLCKALGAHRVPVQGFGGGGRGRLFVRGHARDRVCPPPHCPMGTQVAKGPRHLGDPPSSLHTPTAPPRDPGVCPCCVPSPPQAQAGDTKHSSHILFIVPGCDKGAVPRVFPGTRDVTKVGV